MFSFYYPSLALPYFKIYNDVVVTPLRAFRNAQSQRNGWPVYLHTDFIQRMDVINNIECIYIHNDVLIIGFIRPIDGMDFMFFERPVHLLRDA